jgi:hypothetical protein
MNRMVNVEFPNSGEIMVNVYLDMMHFIFPILKYCMIKDYNVIASSIINYCAHIRQYFRSRHGVDTNIVIVFSDNNSINLRRFCPEYNSMNSSIYYANSKISNAINITIDILQMLCPYLPNIVLKTGTVEPAVIIKNIIDDNILPDVPNIVMNTSQYSFQLPANAKDTVIFKKKIIGGNDSSYSCNVVNALQAFAYETRKINLTKIYNTKYLSVLMALSGFPNRNINSFYNIKTSLNIIDNLPMSCSEDPKAIYGHIVDYLSKKKNKRIISFDLFYNRYRALDIVYQSKMYKELPEYRETSWLNQLNDPDTVKQINNTYFKDCPLNLEWL